MLRRLAGGWVEHLHAASGRLLYHQAGEGLSSWKPPRGLAAPPGYTGHYTDTAGGGRCYYLASGTGRRWDTARDSAGRRYYYTEAGDSEWSLPALSPDLSPDLSPAISLPALEGQVSAVQGGIVGAQAGPFILEHISDQSFKRFFSVFLICTGLWLFFQTRTTP